MCYTPFIDTFNKIRYQHLGLDLLWELMDIIGKTCLLHKNGKLYEETPFRGSTPLLQANPALRQSNLCSSKSFGSHHIYQPIAFYQPNREPSLQGSKVLQGSKISQWQGSNNVPGKFQQGSSKISARFQPGSGRGPRAQKLKPKRFSVGNKVPFMKTSARHEA